MKNINWEEYPQDVKHFFLKNELYKGEREKYLNIDWKNILKGENEEIVWDKIFSLDIPVLKLPLAKEKWPYKLLAEEAKSFSKEEQCRVRNDSWRLTPIRQVVSPTINPYCSKTSYSKKHNVDRDKVIIDWSAESESCPETRKWLETTDLFNHLDRVSYYYVHPKGYISPHKDLPEKGAGVQGPNWALVHPENCYWLMEDWGVVDWEPGEVYFLDFGRLHSILNLSDEVRIHMMITANLNKKVVVDLFKKEYLP